MQIKSWAIKCAVSSTLLVALTLGAQPSTLEGRWEAHFNGVGHVTPKSFGQFTFDFHVEGNKLTGTAHIDGWPGDAPITDGIISGDHISFITLGSYPSSSGFPRFRYQGTIQTNEMKLDFFYGYEGQNEASATKMQLVATKLPTSGR
jgi:hypothetical protein